MRRGIEIRLSRLAKADLRSATDWYEAQGPGLGKVYLRAVVDTFDAIVDRADTFQVVHADVPRALVRKFPYGVFFRKSPGLIRMIAIIHPRRNPGTWRRRI